MRTIGIDLGTRRIGLALSDTEGRLASPLLVMSVSSPEAAIAPILEIVRREDVKRLVVGLPINMDDTLGPAATSTITWARQLATRANMPLLFVDERLSSFEAEQQLVGRKRAGEKLTRKRKKAKLDALAAASFLQAYLDGKLAAVDVPQEQA